MLWPCTVTTTAPNFALSCEQSLKRALRLLRQLVNDLFDGEVHIESGPAPDMSKVVAVLPRNHLELASQPG